MKKSNRKWWLAWLLTTMSLGGLYAYGLTAADKSAYLPGETSHGHYQIEMVCDACHADAFAGAEAMQQACVDCHGADLEAVDDSHPKSKFTDPRNADRVAILDARRCVTCHVEHKPGRTRAMGVTLPDDYCFYCHQDVAEDRPSHRDMTYDTCAAAGCHNYHDNQALYEDFLVKHAPQVAGPPQGRVPQRNLAEHFRRVAEHNRPVLNDQNHDGPPTAARPAVVAGWAASAHAKSGVNCSHCHGAEGQWQDKPGPVACKRCHGLEVEGFLAGKHGMRLAQGLSPLEPAMARLAMKDDALERQHGCNSCHGAHDYDTRRAAVEACLGCHDDGHSRAYKQGPHYKQWLARSGRGVSCATCHLPRQTVRERGAERTLVQHNQNLNLRPNEKMIRSVCLHCHDLRFSLDALADVTLVSGNFEGPPSRHIQSMDMALAREAEDEAKRPH